MRSAGGPRRYDRAMANELPDDVDGLDRIEGALKDVERALRRLDDGTYQTCEACGGPIDESVLAQGATRRRCANHGVAPEAVDRAGVGPSGDPA
jgi:RNA polymerase-binding transcription factor DksA